MTPRYKKISDLKKKYGFSKDYWYGICGLIGYTYSSPNQTGCRMIDESKYLEFLESNAKPPTV